MPLPSCIAEEKTIEHRLLGHELTSRQLIQMTRQQAEKNNLPLKNVTYVLDLEFYDDEDEYVDFCRYEVPFSNIGAGKVIDYSHNIEYEGSIKYTLVKLARKPKLRVKELMIPIKSTRFDSELAEYEVKVLMRDLYNKATQELGALGLPQINTTKQSYRLKFAYYYLDEQLSESSLLWNPYRSNDAANDEFLADEFTKMMVDRPDHVRLIDIRLEFVSLFWLQEWITKLLDSRLGHAST